MHSFPTYARTSRVFHVQMWQDVDHGHWMAVQRHAEELCTAAVHVAVAAAVL